MKITYQAFWFIVYSLWFMAGACFAQQEKFFEVKAKKFSYAPNIIEVNKGELVRIRLISEDVHHGFFIDGYGISTSAHPGQEGSLKFVADKTGRFSFRCSVTCGEFHPYMVGYLIVKPNSRFNMYSAAVILIGLGSLVIVFRKKENEQG
jgi:cytochrome c oxidase subunit 2